MKTAYIRTGLKAIIAGLFIFAGTEASAQLSKSFGFKAGVNSSRIEGLGSNELKNNFTGGLFMEWLLGSHFALSTDLIYSGKGAEIEVMKGYDETEDLSNSVTLHYVELPVLAQFLFKDPANSWRPKLVVGPAFGLLTGSNQTGTYQANFHDFDFGIVAGGGINFLIGARTSLNLDARYTYGLYEIAAGDVSNRNLGVTAGLAFTLGD